MGISSRNDIFCMKKGCFLPLNRAFFRFISSELIPIFSEEKGISSELIAITSEIFGINRHFFGINATKKSKYIYIFFSIRACAHACARENFQENIGRKGISFIHKKKEKRKSCAKKKRAKRKPHNACGVPCIIFVASRKWSESLSFLPLVNRRLVLVEVDNLEHHN